jgi:hypothetical protein
VITTPDLIDALAARATPVKRLRTPVLRATIWLAFALFILALLAIGQGVRADIEERLRQPVFVIGLAGSMITGVLAAIATFMISLPDRSRFWALLPVPALVVWVSTIGYGCLTAWISFGPDGIQMGEAVRCFATLVLTSLPLSFAMLIMVRYAAPLRPTAVTMIGALAVAAITSTALSLFHDLDATIMVLIWNLGTAALIVALAGVLGRQMFSWVAPRADQPLNG